MRDLIRNTYRAMNHYEIYSLILTLISSILCALGKMDIAIYLLLLSIYVVCVGMLKKKTNNKMKFSIIRTSNMYRGPKPCDDEKITFLYENQWGEKIWQIEINTLEELMEFIEKYGCIVITPKNPDYRGLPEIEIYDDYRE